MKKSKKYKIAQNGIESNTNALAWDNTNTINGNNIPIQRTTEGVTGATDNITGNVYYKNDTSQMVNPNLNLNNNRTTTKPGNAKLQKYINTANNLIDITTGIAKLSNNNRSNEKNKYLESIQPREYQNNNEQGLNNIPTYFKNGGNLITPEIAKAILKNGKSNGKPLTSKQKAYFGYVIGQSEKAQNGGLITSNDVRHQSYPIDPNLINNSGVSHNYITDPINNNKNRLPFTFDPNTIKGDSWLETPIQGNNYNYNGAVNNYKGPFNIGKAIMNNTEHLMHNNPNSNTYRLENSHYSFDPKTPKLNDTAYMQNGGGMIQPITAEAGEVYKDVNGGMNKIPDHMDTHDDASGGVQVNNAAQVLEDTGDKRNDIDSKLLLIKPKEMFDISGINIKKPITHSKAFELMTADSKKNSDYIQKYLKRNAKSLDSSSNDTYAKNSMDLNVNQLGTVPTQADIFNKLFEHQEDIKNKYQIDNAGNKAQNGLDVNLWGANGKKFTRKELSSKYSDQQVTDMINQKQLFKEERYGLGEVADNWIRKNSQRQTNDNNDGFKSFDSYMPQPDFVQGKPFGNMPMYTPQATTTSQPVVQVPTNNKNITKVPQQSNQGVIAPNTDGIRAYTGDINDKSNASVHSDAEWNQFAKDSGFKGNNNRDFQTHLFNMNGSDGGANIQNSILDLHDQYGNPNTPPSGKSMYNWIDGRLGHRWDKAYEAFYAGRTPQSQISDHDANDYFSPDNNTNNETPQNQPNTGATNQMQGQPNKNPDNSFKAPLKWYDTAAATYGLIDSLGRKGVNYDGVNLVAPHAKYQNPLPTLQQGQEDYNSLINTLPQNGAGMANTANVFGRKYSLNNQTLGNYENINNGIWNQNEQATVSTKNAQSQADYQARQVFEQKQLQGIEAQRQQFFQSLKDLTGVIGANAKYNREGNLLMKLFPAFDQNANYDGYKYNFYNPGRTANYTPQGIVAPKKTNKKTK